MASKTLIRTGSSILNRLFTKPSISQKTTTVNSRIFSNAIDVTPKLFPSLLHLNLSQYDAESETTVANEGFVHPCGLPSHRFFLPEGDDSVSQEPMLLFPKRTFQPSTLKRKRKHGYFARKATKGGRNIIARRIAKGRSRITA